MLPYLSEFLSGWLHYNAYRLTSILGPTVLLTWATTRYATSRNLKKSFGAVAKYRTNLATPASQETLYLPTGLRNPKTEAGKELWDQQIIGDEHKIALIDIFDSEQGAKLLDFILKAMKECTPEEPVVFAHLHKVIPERHYEATMDAIKAAWIGYFSEHFSVLEKLEDFERGSRLRPIFDPVVPVLTVQQGPKKKHSRIVYLRGAFLDAAKIPDVEDVRFPTANGFIHDPEHTQAPRVAYTTTTARIMALHPEFNWKIDVPTGRYEMVAELEELSLPLFPDAEIAENHIQ